MRLQLDEDGCKFKGFYEKEKYEREKKCDFMGIKNDMPIKMLTFVS